MRVISEGKQLCWMFNDTFVHLKTLSWLHLTAFLLLNLTVVLTIKVPCAERCIVGEITLPVCVHLSIFIWMGTMQTFPALLVLVPCLAAAILKHSCFWRGLFTSSVSFLSFEAESLWKLIVESLERHQRRGAVLGGWHFQPAPFRKLPALKRPWPQAFGLHRGWNTEISALMPFKDIVFSMHLLLLNALHYLKYYSIES